MLLNNYIFDFYKTLLMRRILVSIFQKLTSLNLIGFFLFTIVPVITKIFLFKHQVAVKS